MTENEIKKAWAIAYSEITDVIDDLLKEKVGGKE